MNEKFKFRTSPPDRTGSGNLKFDGPGRVREGQSGTAGGALASSPHLRMQARRAGPTAASFSSHVSQGFPLQVLPRSAAATTFPASPQVMSANFVGSDGCNRRYRHAWTGRPAGGTVTLCIAILTNHSMASQHCFWGFSSNTASILHCAQRRGQAEVSQVSTAISGFSRRTTAFSV
jgi:hypothetical protein